MCGTETAPVSRRGYFAAHVVKRINEHEWLLWRRVALI
jgi:hypothetical protein